MSTDFSSQLIYDVTSLSTLSPLQLHSFLQFLIRYEKAPGGPYIFPVNDVELRKLNQHIFNLFRAVHKPLPNIETFLSVQSAPPHPEAAHAHRLESVRAQALHQLLGKEAYNTLKPLITKLESVDATGELSKLTSTLAYCLTETGITTSITHRTLGAIGEANFLIWIAYSLYDQLLDETPDPHLLPIANQVLRFAVETYLNAGISFNKINKALQVVDQANEYEMRMCRMPIKNGSIALLTLPSPHELIRLQSERSLVHCFGLLCLIEKTALKKKTTEITELFKEYCAARQFNDDIHDWQEDLINGRITYPVHWLLSNASITSGTHQLDELIPKLQRLFWEEGLVKLVSECLERSKKVRNGYCKGIGLKRSSSFDTLTIGPIITACQQALQKHAFETAFLEVTRTQRSTVGF